MSLPDYLLDDPEDRNTCGMCGGPLEMRSPYLCRSCADAVADESADKSIQDRKERS
jgi:hypothetical protein